MIYIQEPDEKIFRALPYLSKVRDSDGSSVPINLHPFVGLGIAVPLLNCRYREKTLWAIYRSKTCKTQTGYACSLQASCRLHNGRPWAMDRIECRPFPRLPMAMGGATDTMTWKGSPLAKPRAKTVRRAMLTLLPTWLAVGLAQHRPVRCAAVAAS